MAKIVTLYTKPDDVEGFEEHYRSTHMPLAMKVPGAQWSLTRWTTTPRGGEPDFFLMAEASFASEEDLQAGLASPEMRETGKDAMQMTRQFGSRATMLIGTDYS